MRYVIKQCKHCGTRYTYQASGEGCFDGYNNRDYCPECYQALLNAFNNIPVKYHPQFVEIKKDDTLIEALSALKDKYDKESLNSTFRGFTKVVRHHGDEFTYEGKHYLYEDGKLYILGQCDADGKFTGNYWIEDDIGWNQYIPTQGTRNDIDFADVKPMKMPPPSGKLFYMTTDDTTTGTASPDINQILSDDEAVKRMIKSVKLYKSH